VILLGGFINLFVDVGIALCLIATVVFLANRIKRKEGSSDSGADSSSSSNRSNSSDSSDYSDSGGGDCGGGGDCD